MASQTSATGSDWPVKGFCLSVPKPEDFALFKRLVGEVLPAHGCNTLVLLTRYRYEFQSHPEVREPGSLTADQAGELARLCRDVGIRVIPKMNLLGHQSGKKRGSEQGLLRAHPEFDETPDKDEVPYCRSLCPRHPRVKDVVFSLADELIEAFAADAIHVGLDEVFEIGHCARCRGTSNAELFAEWVSALHAHFVGERNVEMLMWGDRLLDAEATGYGTWEAAGNGTSPAIDRIPTDIIICDWHYSARDDYPSVGIFTGKGFRTVVCPWKKLEATEALLAFAAAHASERLQGVLATSWCDAGMVARCLLAEDGEVSETARLVGESFQRAMRGGR